MNHESSDESEITPATIPRRWLLRALTAATVGVGTLVGLAGCGGNGGEDEEEDEEEDD